MTAESRSPVPPALYQDDLVDEEAELPHRLALGGRVLKHQGMAVAFDPEQQAVTWWADQEQNDGQRRRGAIRGGWASGWSHSAARSRV